MMNANHEHWKNYFDLNRTFNQTLHALQKTISQLPITMNTSLILCKRMTMSFKKTFPDVWKTKWYNPEAITNDIILALRSWETTCGKLRGMIQSRSNNQRRNIHTKWRAQQWKKKIEKIHTFERERANMKKSGQHVRDSGMGK